MKKEIGYSYPTSTNAVRFGYGKTGCYHVDLVDAKNKVNTLFKSESLQDCKDYADNLPNQWNPLYLKYPFT